MKKKIRNNSQRFHRIFGACSSIFLIIIVGTGILLMNPNWIGKDLTITTAIQDKKGTWIGTKSGLFYKEKNNSTLLPISIPYSTSSIVGIINHPIFLVAFKDNLLLKKTTDNQWEQIAIPIEINELWDLRSNDQNIILTTDNGIYLYQNRTWTQQVKVSNSQINYWIKKIHTGYFGGDWVRTLFHSLSWITIALILTGIRLLFKKKH